MKVLHIVFAIIMFGLFVNLISSATSGNASFLKSSIISLCVMGGLWLIVGIAGYCIKHKDYGKKKDDQNDNK